ncbi:unnamed protein product [Vicia faba]|uniref:Uncharacterized protein n=1 Tax=Vicia faba TaxID=3906 RepID=A0AAV1AN72_VICFA|nr:unnamed protein product [Vicia faba]
MGFSILTTASLHGETPTVVNGKEYAVTTLQYLNLGNNENLKASCSQLLMKGWERIQVLDLSINKLHGRLPSSIGNLTYLIYLDLHDNAIEGGIPSSIEVAILPEEAGPKRGRVRSPVNGGSRGLDLTLEIRSFGGEGGGNAVKRTNEAEGEVIEGKAERRKDVFQRLVEGLGEAYDRDIAFANALETFGGGHNNPINVDFKGPVMTKFPIALREIRLRLTRGVRSHIVGIVKPSITDSDNLEANEELV